MRTFKDLQDSVLSWVAETGDTDKMLTLTKDAINQAQRAFLAREQYDFMLSPTAETISVEAGRKHYPLNALFGSMLYVYNPVTDDWMEEISAKGLLEHGENPYDATQSQLKHYMLTSVWPVKRQPTTTGLVTISTGGSPEAAANSVIIKGLNNSGEYVEETLSSGSTWIELESTNSFTTITDVVKSYTSWTYQISLVDTADVVLLVLPATEYAKQYRQLEFIKAPETAQDIVYRYYMKTKKMVENYDSCHVPEEFDQILVYRALIEMQGYVRPTESELNYWIKQADKLEHQCSMAYTQTRSLGGRPSYVQYRERY
jgi:hypothetical protein